MHHQTKIALCCHYNSSKERQRVLRFVTNLFKVTQVFQDQRRVNRFLVIMLIMSEYVPNCFSESLHYHSRNHVVWFIQIGIVMPQTNLMSQLCSNSKATIPHCFSWVFLQVFCANVSTKNKNVILQQICK